MKRFWRWITGPKRVRVEGVHFSHPEIVSMCPIRGDVLIAMRSGAIFHAKEDAASGVLVFHKITILQDH